MKDLYLGLPKLSSIAGCSLDPASLAESIDMIFDHCVAKTNNESNWAVELECVQILDCGGTKTVEWVYPRHRIICSYQLRNQTTQKSNKGLSSRSFSLTMDDSGTAHYENGLSQSTSPTRKRKRVNDAAEVLEIKINAPEPPSKKALRRAKKGKTAGGGSKKSDKISLNPTSEEEIPAKSSPSKRSEFGIWIGNLPWSATKADVCTFITTNTQVAENTITRFHMPTPRDPGLAPAKQNLKPQNKGFAYIDFSTDSAVSQAIALSETLLKGRKVLIKDSKSFEGRPEKLKDDKEALASASVPGKSPNKRIFVGNLAFDTSEEDLKEHFSRCGAVANVHVATFEDSGKCKGYAWIEFQELKAGEAAVRGWVDHEEEVPQGSEDEEAGGGEEESSKSKLRGKKRKTRKWWVNKFKGRPLRMEFAEDKSMRYKKRYGKDGAARQNGVAISTKQADVSIPTPALSVNSSKSAVPRAAEAPGSSPIWQKEAPKNTRGTTRAAAPRLTGGIVPSEGNKMKFE